MVEEHSGEGWLSLNEAAVLLGVSTDTVRRRMKRGEFQSRQIPTPHGPAYQVLCNPLPNQSATLAATLADPTEEETSEAQKPLALIEMVRLMEKLQEENSRLQLKAESAAMWQGRAEMLALQLQKAEDQIKMLAAPKKILDKESNESDKPWWKFW
jgi:hypothetical protein